MDIRTLPLEPNQLGEGPTWRAETAELVRVDITAGEVHHLDPTTGHQRTEVFGGEVSAAVPRIGGGLLLAVDRRLELVGADGGRRVIAEVEPEHDDNRFNDCRVDPAGRLWAGTMSKTRTAGVAALYRLDPDGELVTVLPHLTLSNGMGWSPDTTTMYHVDSTTQRVDQYDFDIAGGTLGERRVFATIDPGDGLPDGLCVDAAGGVWLSLFGGGAVRRYDAEGVLTDVVPLPVTNPTCPAFGGPDLDTLYITTARHRLSPEQLDAEPAAGRVLAFQPAIPGLEPNVLSASQR